MELREPLFPSELVFPFLPTRWKVLDVARPRLPLTRLYSAAADFATRQQTLTSRISRGDSAEPNRRRLSCITQHILMGFSGLRVRFGADGAFQRRTTV